MPWSLESDAALPPLPPALEAIGAAHDPVEIPSGCYRVRLTPEESRGLALAGHLSYDGTLRIERVNGGLLASGDLYVKRDGTAATSPELSFDEGIPTFSQSDYRYYVRLVGAEIFDDSVHFRFGLHRFEHTDATWSPEAAVTACLRPSSTSATSEHSFLLAGPVHSERHAGREIGALEMGHVASCLRTATVRVDHVTDLEPPSHNRDGRGWEQIYAEVGWDVRLQSHEMEGTNADDAWGRTKLHRKMRELREGSSRSLSEWVYHVLCVGFIDSPDKSPLGLMYDTDGSDILSGGGRVFDRVPREGAAIAARKKLGKRYGSYTDRTLAEEGDLFLRTAIHEVGHAQQLLHDPSRAGLMRPLAEAHKEDPDDFPANLNWAFSDRDALLLKHRPDIWVRPGGLPWKHRHRHISVDEEDAVETPATSQMRVTAYDSVLPLGAPLRIQLRYEVERSQPPPPSVALKSGLVTGLVKGPGGSSRSFSPTIVKVDQGADSDPEPGDVLLEDMTLLRGREGALMPQPGTYEIEVGLTWWNRVSRDKHRVFRLIESCSVLVMSPRHRHEAEAALALLSEPTTMLPLIYGDDPHGKGERAVRRATLSPILGPHLAMIEARRLAGTIGKLPKARRVAVLEKAALLLSSAILTLRELRHSLEIFLLVPEENRSRPAFVAMLHHLHAKAIRINAPSALISRLAGYRDTNGYE